MYHESLLYHIRELPPSTFVRLSFPLLYLHILGQPRGAKRGCYFRSGSIFKDDWGILLCLTGPIGVGIVVRRIGQVGEVYGWGRRPRERGVEDPTRGEGGMRLRE